jgi:hypothetical protein
MQVGKKGKSGQGKKQYQSQPLKNGTKSLFYHG